MDPSNKRRKRQGYRHHATKTLGLVLIILLGILIVSGFTLHRNIHHRPNVNEILTNAGLAVLPQAIENLMVDTRPLIGTGRGGKRHIDFNRRVLFVRFEAEPQAIDSFIDNSESIDRTTLQPLKRCYGSRDEAPMWWWNDEAIAGRSSNMSWQEDNVVGSRLFVHDDNGFVRIVVVYPRGGRTSRHLRVLHNIKNRLEWQVQRLFYLR